MNLKPLYIIFVIAIFNFILINIFRLQNEITDIRNKKKKVDDMNKKLTLERIKKSEHFCKKSAFAKFDKEVKIGRKKSLYTKFLKFLKIE